MTILRLFVLDGPEQQPRTYTQFPVRVGRHPDNDCQIVDSRVSRFHAELRVEGTEMIVTDLSSVNGTFLDDGLGVRRLQRASTRLRGNPIRLAFGAARAEAFVESGATALRQEDDVATMLVRGANAVLDACKDRNPPAEHADAQLDAMHHIVDAFFRSLVSVRHAVRRTDGVDCDEERGRGDRSQEEAIGLLRWTQATSVALHTMEHGLEALRHHNAEIALEAREAIAAILDELAPERLHGGAFALAAEPTSARSALSWVRYNEKHRGLLQRHARRPSALMGRRLAAADERVARAIAATAPASAAGEAEVERRTPKSGVTVSAPSRN
jgi:pSer/pThr/pTyr-binding forkhead associated (FHA) protein